MKAAIINKWGGPDVFEYTTTEKPVPAPNQLLIKVLSTSVNPVDFKQRKGNHRHILGAPFPIILGYDVCGEVVEIGSNIKNFAVGDIVFGDLDNKYGGALAEYAVGTEKAFALKPDNCSTNEASAFPLAALTAYQALKHKANLKSEQTILINGASGGVGHFATQIAKILGAKTIAVSSGKNEEFVKELGADEFINYKKSDVLECSEKVDVFFDVIGNYSFLKTKHLLSNNGIYINTLPRPKILLHKILQAFTSGKKVMTLLRKHSSSDLKQLAQWINEGKLKVNIDKEFELKDSAQAHEYAEKGRTKGKIIIRI